MTPLAENIWLQTFPLSLLGCELGRNVTAIRLASGKLVIHSTAPFQTDDLVALYELGTPAWLVEATLFHDTYGPEGCAALPDLPYLAPEGMTPSLNPSPIVPPPSEWEGEIEVIPLEGMPKVREHLFFHRPSATLVVGDLIFNLSPRGWTRLFMRAVGGLRTYPGMSRFFRAMIRDRTAFRRSIADARVLPFERIVVAHGTPITENAKEAFDAVLSPHGF